METPVWTMRRRPFLAPLWLGALALLVVVIGAASLYQSATTTFIVIVPDAEAMQGGIADPPLAPEGEERAERLARLFGGAGGAGRIAAIYSSPARRAQQTVAPLAALQRLPVEVLGSDATGLAATHALREQRGRVALLVGDTPLTSQWLASLGMSTPAGVRADDSASLYIVSIPTLGSARLLQLQY